MLSGAKACKSCRSRQELSNEYLCVKFGVGTAESEPLKVCQKLAKVRMTVRKNIGVPRRARMVARHHNEAVRREEFGPVNVARAERAGAVREDNERPLAGAPERYLLRRLTPEGRGGLARHTNQPFLPNFGK